MSNISFPDLSSNSDLDLTDLSSSELDLKGGFWWLLLIPVLFMEHD